MKHKIPLTLLALMLCVSAFCVTALASAGSESERLEVTTAWTDGELLKIDVRDTETGYTSALELRISDYAENCETISIQAVDESGNKSGVIQVKNPYYKPPATASADTGTDDSTHSPANSVPSSSESAVPEDSTPTETFKPKDGSNPFTPDGTGAVTDNASEKEGKEFFTITTEDKNVFYLIVDRQKTGDNVYLLSAVTENDLSALAKKGDGTTASAVPEPEPSPSPSPSPEASPEPVPESSDSGGGNSGIIIFIALAALAAGGAGYYFKIYKPQKQAAEYDDDSEYESGSEELDEADDPDESDYINSEDDRE